MTSGGAPRMRGAPLSGMAVLLRRFERVGEPPWGGVEPGRDERAAHGGGPRPAQVHVRTAPSTPGTLHRHKRLRVGLHEHRLLLRRELDHAPTLGGPRGRGEDLPGNAKIRVPHMDSLPSTGLNKKS